MHTVLQRLHRDHEHIDRVLNLLEQQIDAFHEGQPIDFELISNVLHYMADYADQVHHRLEDQLFDPLKDRSDPIGATVRQVMGQHPHLIVRTRQFEKTAEGVIHDAVVTREEFEQQARAFIGLQREHLRLEEEKLLPMLEGLVDGAVMEAAARVLPTVEDPLFGSHRREQFLYLYQRLRALEADAGSPARSPKSS
jgi:hemerythrin-like domain-containing protein